MPLSKAEQDDTTKYNYTPRNLLEYFELLPIKDDFISLLTKHNKSLSTLIKTKPEIHEIKEAIFIVKLNKFDSDLIKISNLCAEINSETRKHQENIEQSREALQNRDSSALAKIAGSLYRDARNYDKNFNGRFFLPKLNGRPFLINSLMLNPFHHNPDAPNEENILNLVATFNIHDDFFKNFLNVLYVDGKDGQDFLGKTFEEVSSAYKNISAEISEITKIIPKSAPERIIKNIQSKHDHLKRIMAKYPATLHLATRNILEYLENTATTSRN